MTRASIEPIGPGDVGSLRSLVASCPFKPNRFAFRGPDADLDTFRLRLLVERTERGGALVCVADGRPMALAVYEPLSWESRVLGRRIFGLQDIVVDPSVKMSGGALDLLVAAVCHATTKMGAETIHCKRPTRDLRVCHALERAEFHLMDTQLVYAVDLRRPSGVHQAVPGATVRPATPADTEALVKVARASFQDHYGRFHADARFAGDSPVKLYEEWVRSGLAGYADLTLVAEAHGAIRAYSMWRNPSPAEAQLSVRIGHYSIGAVDPEFAGRGLFTLVTACGMSRLKSVADWLVGPTHVNNYGVQRGYSRLGWAIEDATHTFHKWLAPI